MGELALSQHDFLKVDAVYLSAPLRSHGGSLDTQNEIGIPLQLTPGALLSPAEHCPAKMASLVFFPGINSPGAWHLPWFLPRMCCPRHFSSSSGFPSLNFSTQMLSFLSPSPAPHLGSAGLPSVVLLVVCYNQPSASGGQNWTGGMAVRTRPHDLLSEWMSRQMNCRTMREHRRPHRNPASQWWGLQTPRS